jgi:hypothetical protein
VTVLALLDETRTVATYKPALLLALLSLCGERPDVEEVAVRDLAERVVEAYWPQTVEYAGAGVLAQNQGRPAKVVTAILRFREAVCSTSRGGLSALKHGPAWEALLDAVERSLAEMPIPRLQEPLEPFLYRFDWPWEKDGRWSERRYLESSRAIRLEPGAAAALGSLAPLLRPFVLRWWADKAAQLNRERIPDAQALVRFEHFLFGRDRAALARLRDPLADLQDDRCLYCDRLLGAVEVDHFLPWSATGDDGLDNLVAACPRCNGEKRNALAGVRHVEALLARNAVPARPHLPELHRLVAGR